MMDDDFFIRNDFNDGFTLVHQAVAKPDIFYSNSNACIFCIVIIFFYGKKGFLKPDTITQNLPCSCH